MTQEPGLRERKKERTRRQIAEPPDACSANAASRPCTVAAVAAAAEVSEATVFNYFPSKEDLFYSGLEVFEENLLSAIRYRASGQSALAAFAGSCRTPRPARREGP